jgi:hypothetical protein
MEIDEQNIRREKRGKNEKVALGGSSSSCGLLVFVSRWRRRGGGMK